MKWALGIGISILILGIAMIATETPAAVEVCERCELVDLPWELGLSSLCLQLNYEWGWEWCLDGSHPGDYCILSNKYCDADGTDEPPEL
jgi:hypothetical protein